MKQMKEYQGNTLLKSVSTLEKQRTSELFGSSSQTSLGDDSLGSFWPSGFHLKGEYETGKGHSRIFSQGQPPMQLHHIFILTTELILKTRKPF